ncbi:MAG: zinc ribbon domain-containing protein [Candidatus Dojkabacteria bacterium]
MEQFILNFLDSVSKIDFKSVWEVFFYALAIFWIVVLYWIWLDSGDRTSNIFARIGYVLLGTIFNVIGLVIYLIIRPSQTIEEIYWSDLERRYIKFETSELGDCPKCGTQLYPGFKFCPECRYRLKIKCPSCNIYMDRKYKYCPHCGNEVHNSNDFVPLKTPTKEVMQEQITASRIEATEVVETSRTRYSVRKGIAMKVGEVIVEGYKIIFRKLKEILHSIKRNSDNSNNKVEELSEKKRKKKNKKKNRR